MALYLPFAISAAAQSRSMEATYNSGGKGGRRLGLLCRDEGGEEDWSLWRAMRKRKRGFGTLFFFIVKQEIE
jgi:hypothetical protein